MGGLLNRQAQDVGVKMTTNRHKETTKCKELQRVHYNKQQMKNIYNNNRDTQQPIENYLKQQHAEQLQRQIKSSQIDAQ